MISNFKGNYSFLSNFFEVPVEFEGITYQNTEAAFQAQKTLSFEERKRFSCLSPNDAKRAGRRVSLRPDWESIKIDTMYKVCLAKFTQHKELKKKLLATGNELLIEGNNWNDTFWGQVNGVGENHLGRILMRIRDEFRYCKQPASFNSVKAKESIISWIRNYMAYNGSNETKIIVGISGGKDSTIAAALAVEALGKDRVVGVLMPQGTQPDIEDSYRVVKHLGIKYYEINIGPAIYALMQEISNAMPISEQAQINSPARIRMTTLYAIAACEKGRVINTCNLSEDFVGYSTKFGDSAGDFSPFANLTVNEVKQIGLTLDIPQELVLKTPSDGLCGKTDEDNLGFTYNQLDTFIRLGRNALSDKTAVSKIEQLHIKNLHKLCSLPKFKY